MTRRATFFSLALMALMTLTAPVAQANVLVTDLSKDQISIRGDFTGETLLLFGAIDPTPHGPVDGVVVVLRGPGESVTLRKKQKSFGIWVNQQAYRMGPLPGFLATVSSAPLSDLAPAERAAAIEYRGRAIGRGAAFRHGRRARKTRGAAGFCAAENGRCAV